MKVCSLLTQSEKRCRALQNAIGGQVVLHRCMRKRNLGHCCLANQTREQFDDVEKEPILWIESLGTWDHDDSVGNLIDHKWKFGKCKEFQRCESFSPLNTGNLQKNTLVRFIETGGVDFEGQAPRQRLSSSLSDFLVGSLSAETSDSVSDCFYVVTCKLTFHPLSQAG